jgi:hypothetical protein
MDIKTKELQIGSAQGIAFKGLILRVQTKTKEGKRKWEFPKWNAMIPGQ